MDRIAITGNRPLQGTIGVSGAKNAALPILASTLLSKGECLLSNIPHVVDVITMGKVLGVLGATVQTELPSHRVSVRADQLQSVQAPYELVKTMRASILVLGPLLARCGEAVVSLPGGCAIGARPVDLHLAGLERLGAKVEITHGYIQAQADQLKGNRVYLDIPSVTGTENLMMAACLARGTTVLENAAKEPEVVDLANFLVKRGAKVHGAGTDVITVEGVPCLEGADHAVIPDRIEAGTYLVAGAITQGDVTVEHCVPDHLKSVMVKLREAGGEVTQGKEWVRFKSSGRTRGVDIKTFAYPGFPTDMQAQMMALMCVSEGNSVITESVFEGRFIHIPELQRMGAEIKVDGHHAVVRGQSSLTGAQVMASDLRASAGLILAGLAAHGETEISRVYHLDRGYEAMEHKLMGLGASIRRVKRSSVTPGG